MTKYKETTITGESWVRAYQVVCNNPLNDVPTIAYSEETIINLGDGEVIKKPFTRPNAQLVIESFASYNAQEEIELINPITSESLGTTATYQDFYVLVHSLYFHLTRKLDRGPKPYPSWTWSNEQSNWVPPVPYPVDEYDYTWNETNQTWDFVRPPQPYLSWIWNNETKAWEAPIPKPVDGNEYGWNESTQSWDLIVAP